MCVGIIPSLCGEEVAIGGVRATRYPLHIVERCIGEKGSSGPGAGPPLCCPWQRGGEVEPTPSFSEGLNRKEEKLNILPREEVIKDGRGCVHLDQG